MCAEWTDLEKDLNGWLKDFGRGGRQYRNPNQAIIGFPWNGFKSDGMLTDDNVLLAIEIESHQKHPDTNAGKYWLLHEKHKAFSRIILFHIYTPLFTSYPWRKQLAEFYIAHMTQVPIEYRVLDYRKESDYARILTQIKEIVLEKLKQLGWA